MKIRNQPSPVLDAHLEAELFAGLAPLEPSAELRAALRDRILGAIGGVPGNAIEDGSGALDFVTVHHGEGEWRRIAPRILEKRLVDASGVYACMLRMEAGAMLPPHDHPTPEESIVLEGEVWLGDVFCRAGDFHFAPRGQRHGAIRTDTGCLLYVRTGGRKATPLL